MISYNEEEFPNYKIHNESQQKSEIYLYYIFHSFQLVPHNRVQALIENESYKYDLLKNRS